MTILLVLITAAFALLPARWAVAVVLHAGNGNTDPESLAAPAVGGPAVTEFGYYNVGKSSTDGGAVTYLGNRWVLSAGHNSIGSVAGPIKFARTDLPPGSPVVYVDYTVVDSTITYLRNPDDTKADLQLFQIETDPGLPSITSQLMLSSTPAIGSRQIMIGNGLNNGAQYFWDVDASVWTTPGGPPGTPPGDASGFDVVGGHTIRWGENEVEQVGVEQVHTFNHGGQGPLFIYGYTTQFDDALYTGVTPLDSEAHVTTGDSGGAVLTLEGGVWKLSGIMITIDEIYNGQPFVAAGTCLPPGQLGVAASPLPC